jgi:hypothetical protein
LKKEKKKLLMLKYEFSKLKDHVNFASVYHAKALRIVDSVIINVSLNVILVPQISQFFILAP